MTARRSLVALTAALVALAATGAARADSPRIRLTPEGQAAARVVVVKRPDLGTTATWTGGARKPDLSSSPPCPGYEPKQSDLVVTGAARSTWRTPGLTVDNSAQVMATERMVLLDWQRSSLTSKALGCLRAALAKEIGKQGRVVSVARTSFPKVARYTAAVRAVVDVHTSTGSVRVMTDFVFLGAGRTEIVFVVTAPLVARAPVRKAELRLADLLVARIAL